MTPEDFYQLVRTNNYMAQREAVQRLNSRERLDLAVALSALFPATDCCGVYMNWLRLWDQWSTPIQVIPARQPVLRLVARNGEQLEMEL